MFQFLIGRVKRRRCLNRNIFPYASFNSLQVESKVTTFVKFCEQNEMFQFLIGRVKRNIYPVPKGSFHRFQFLIGRVKRGIYKIEYFSHIGFQFLIGRVKSGSSGSSNSLLDSCFNSLQVESKVIYPTYIRKPFYPFQFLIGRVKSLQMVNWRINTLKCFNSLQVESKGVVQWQKKGCVQYCFNSLQVESKVEESFTMEERASEFQFLIGRVKRKLDR